MPRRMPGGGWFRDQRHWTRALGYWGLGLILILAAPALGQGQVVEPTANSLPLMVPPPSTKLGLTSDGSNSSTPGWWVGTPGMALALAAFGGLSLASRRWGSTNVRQTGLVRVISRTSLSPRHAVYLVKMGNRTLLIGTGPQGSPTLLSELATSEESGGGR